jgi:hypothetical protein
VNPDFLNIDSASSSGIGKFPPHFLHPVFDLPVLKSDSRGLAVEPHRKQRHSQLVVLFVYGTSGSSPFDFKNSSAS